MSYEDRDLREHVRALIDARPVPDRALTPAGARTPVGLLLGVGVLVTVAIVVGTQLGTRTPVTGPDATASATPTAPTASAPANQVAAERLELPADFTGFLAMVSPNARFVGAIARDYSRAVLWRIERRSPPTDVSQLVQVAEVRGQIGQLAWMEDSSALLVQVARSSTSAGGSSPVPSQMPGALLLETDGRVVQATRDVSSFAVRRAGLSPDGRWIPVYAECCGSPVRLLSRDGAVVRIVVASPSDGSWVSFFGWDKSGLLLYTRIWPDHSTLYAADLNGTVRYSVEAPREFGGTGWGTFAQPADRSWQLIQFGRGIGYFIDGYRLLIDGALQNVPKAIEDSWQYGVFASGNELTYRGADGGMRAYNVRTGATRTLALRVPADPSVGLTTIGALDRYFVWMRLIRGFVGDLDTGNSVELPLQSPPNVDLLQGANLAEYRSDSIAIIDLASWMRTFR